MAKSWLDTRLEMIFKAEELRTLAEREKAKQAAAATEKPASCPNGTTAVAQAPAPKAAK